LVFATIEPTSCDELLDRKSREPRSLEIWLRNRADAVEALGSWMTRLSQYLLLFCTWLAFLHEGFVPHIIHQDMKLTKILLDENFKRRISDSGLTRIISACETHAGTTQHPREQHENEVQHKRQCVKFWYGHASFSQDGHLQGKKMWKEVGPLLAGYDG
jgi:serine/threonine protein kinase